MLEEQFLNNRLTWLGFTQTLLFGAYGISLMNKNQLSEVIGDLSWLVSLIGFTTSLLIFLGVIAAILAMYKLKKIYQMEDYFVSFYTTIMGWICSAGIPLTFIFAWAWLIFKNWKRL